MLDDQKNDNNAPEASTVEPESAPAQEQIQELQDRPGDLVENAATEAASSQEEEVVEEAPPIVSDTDEESSGKEKKKGQTSQAQLREELLEQFHRIMEATPDAGTKLQRAIDFMEASLAQKDTPHFKNFWEARRFCMELFKDTSINPVLRSTLWNKQVELSDEARRLKTMLDEQSAFAVEQIEIAIKSLEDDLNRFEELVSQSGPVKLPDAALTLKNSKHDYQSWLGPIQVLNAFAARTNALRKELIHTDMRVRTKNTFFQRLSSAGDLIFPKRKQLIREMSEAYQEDISSFQSRCQKSVQNAKNLRELREEIKALQAASKIVTLNTRAFVACRKKLSLCWEMVRKQDKERREEREKTLQEFAKAASDIQQKIEGVDTAFTAGEITAKVADDKLSQIQTEMRKTHLGRAEVQVLKEAIQVALKPIQQVLDQQRLEKEKKVAEEKQRIKAVKIDLENQLEEILAGEKSHEDLEAEQARMQQEVKKQKLSQTESMLFGRLLRDLQEKVALQKKSETLASAENQQEQSLLLVKEWKEWQKAVKKQLEEFRKNQDISGFDFETAMGLKEVMEKEKQRLKRIANVIEELQS